MRNRKGMTLIEVVIAMAILAIIVVTLFPAFLITNMLNIISREKTDANYFAQVEIEGLFNHARTHTLEESVIWLQEEAQGYACDLEDKICTKQKDEFIYTLTYGDYAGIESLKIINIIVESIAGEKPGDRAQIEYYMFFDRED